MICNKCGCENKERANYCSKCGNKINLNFTEAETNPAFCNLLNSQKTNSNIGYFTRCAYTILVSKRRYFNIFILISILAISISIFAIAVYSLPDTFINAINVTSSVTEVNQLVESLWREFWIKLIIAILLFLISISVIIVLDKMNKILRTFKINKIGL